MAQLNNLLVTGDSRFLNEIHGKIDWSNVLSKPTIPTVTDTYSATGTAATSGKAVAAALGTLDGTVSGTAGAGKTLTAFSQTDGKVSATFGNISITKSQVSDFPTLGTAAAKDVPSSGNASTTQVVMGNDTRLSNARTPSSHTHGNIQNGGTLQTNDITIASGDKLVVTDSSDSSKIARTSISFDGSTANKCLTQKGTWESFTNNTGTVTSVKVGSTSYSPSSGVVSLPAYPTTLPASDTTSTYSATGTAPVNGTAVAAALATIPSGIVPSAYCDTAAGTAAKTATCTGYTLTTGNYIQVIIKNANSYNGAITLAINGTTAKPIYINGTASSSSNKTLPAGSYDVYYDGTAYQFRTDGIMPGKVYEATKVNGHFIYKDVPNNAVFTDTTYAASTASIGSASTGTAIPADDITAWSAGTLPSLTVTNTSVVDQVTVNMPLAQVSEGVLSFTEASYNYHSTTVGSASGWSAGTAPSLSYTAKSIPNVSVTSKTVVTGITAN